MLKMIQGVAMAMLVMAAGLANAQAVEEDPLAAFIASLQFQQGEVAVPEANARLRLTEGFRYLGKADARRVLEEFWGNPPDDTVLGMLVLYSPVLVACGLGCVKAWRWWSSGALGTIRKPPCFALRCELAWGGPALRSYFQLQGGLRRGDAEQAMTRRHLVVGPLGVAHRAGDEPGFATAAAARAAAGFHRHQVALGKVQQVGVLPVPHPGAA